MTSWRTASVVLLSFSSGLPLGLILIAIPDWMRSAGVDIRAVGLLALAQFPWSFKLLWSPLMDRYPIPWLGRRRGWVAVAQVALLALGIALAGVGHHPDTPWVVGALALAIALAAATQDIAYDAYTVEVLKPEEQGVAVGARTALSRAGMSLAGGISITLAGLYSWPAVNVGLALLYLPMLVVTLRAPEPPETPARPQSLRDAVWEPFLGFLSRHRALEILAFVFFYKFADNLAIALLRPFLVDMKYDEFDRGVALTTIGLAAVLFGAFVGGISTTSLGLGHSLWIFGFLQIFSNVGYVVVATSELNRPLMYAATGFDNLAQGLGTGAFSVLLLRITQKRFSATQYALFSSIFGLPRIIAGPISGFFVDAMGWEAFFWSTLLAGIPGLALLQRFAPLGTREPQIELREPLPLPPLTPARLTARGLAGGVTGVVLAGLCVASMAALKAVRAQPGAGFDLVAELVRLASPDDVGSWVRAAGVLIFGAIAGLGTAAVFAARRGAAARRPDGAG